MFCSFVNKTTNLLLLLLLIGIGSFAASSQHKPKGMNIMKNSGYSMLYANPQQNSYLNVKMTALGELDWSKKYKQDLNKNISPPVAVLVKDNNIGIQINPYFILYHESEFVKWHYIKSFSMNIGIFLDDKYTVVENNGSIDKYFSYSGNILPMTSPHCFVDDWWVPLLISSYNNGIILIEQFTGGPERKPKEFGVFFYVQDYKGTYYGDKGEILNAVVTLNSDIIVLNNGKKLILIDMKTGKKINEIELNSLLILRLSISLSDLIVIHAVDKDKKEKIIALNISGQKKWEHDINGKIINKQPVVCGEEDMVFYICNNFLVCIKNGKILWEKEVFPCLDPLLTLTKENDVIIKSGLNAMAYNNRGEKIFSILLSSDITEKITAPPVAGVDGRIYISSSTTLYCIK